MAETIYVRNMRPNRVILLYAGLRVVLERRGAREDTTSLPADAKNDPTILRWLRAGMIEEISKEDFLNIMASTDAFDPANRDPNEPPVQSNVRREAVPMSPDNSSTPTIIDTDKIDKSLLTPRIDYVNKPEPTSDLAPQEVSVHDYHRGATGRPANLAEADEVASREAVPNTPAKPRATRKTTSASKRKTTTRKSTKK